MKMRKKDFATERKQCSSINVGGMRLPPPLHQLCLLEDQYGDGRNDFFIIRSITCTISWN